MLMQCDMAQEKETMKIRCHFCERVWDYKGLKTADWEYVCCSRCKSSNKIGKQKVMEEAD
jgi:phage FluMu protein Com